MKSVNLKNKILLVFAYFAFLGNVNSLPLPFDIMLKPYVGIAYLYDGTVNNKTLTSQNASPVDDVFNLENFSAHAGLRIHKNFGVDYDYTNFARSSREKVNYTYDIHSVNFNLYYNLFDFIGNGLEVFVGAGSANINTGAFNDTATRVHAGVETRIFGIFRVFASYEKYMDAKLNNAEFDIDVFKIGLSMFFL